jgi:peptidoglycan biosynthesis protein MviN/MurJ (putative lipid II flippase)
VDFVLVYTSGVTDADYRQPVFSIIITGAFSICCVRNIYNILILSAGKFKETQSSSIIQAIMNIVISMLLVFRYGIVGLAMGTFVSMLYQQIYYMVFLHNNIIFQKYEVYFKQIIVDIITGIIICFVSGKLIHLTHVSYYEWGKCAICIFVISLVISMIINMIFYRKNVEQIVSKLSGAIKK